MSPQIKSRSRDETGTATRFAWLGLLGFGFSLGGDEHQFYRYPWRYCYWLWPLGRWEHYRFGAAVDAKYGDWRDRES